MEKTKVCSKCNRDLPATTYYFHKNNSAKSGLDSRCKECKGNTFGIKQPNRTIETKEGYKICCLCLEELPVNDEYFCKTKKTKDGYRSRCKVCEGSNGYGIKQPNKSITTKEGHKICAVCRKELPYQSFSKMNDNKDGYNTRCRSCDYKVKQNTYKNNPKSLEHKKAYAKTYRKKYYSTEKGKIVNVINCQKRRIRKKKSLFYYSTEDWKEVLTHFDNTCAYCGKEGELVQEHVIPLSKGGYYTKQNIIPSCGWCNGSKHDSDMHQWYRTMEFFSEAKLNKIEEWIKFNIDGTQQLSIL